MGYTRFSVPGDGPNYSLKGNIMPATCNSKTKKKGNWLLDKKKMGLKH